MSHRFVTRVVDYEPTAVPASITLPICRAPRPAVLHQPSRARPAGLEHRLHEHELAPQIITFATGTLRRVFEALDRRRPMAQLRPLLAEGPLSSVMAMSARKVFAEPARLNKVRVRASGPAAAELFGTYQRGERIGAIAGRIEYAQDRWLVVALQIG